MHLGVLPASMAVYHAQESGVLRTLDPLELPLELGLWMMVQSQHVGLELRSSRRITRASATDPPLQSLVFSETGSLYGALLPCLPCLLSARITGVFYHLCLELWPLLLLCFLFFETHVAQSTTELTLMPWMTLNSWSSCLQLLSAGVSHTVCLGELYKILTDLLKCEQKSLQCCFPVPCFAC